MIYNYFYIFPFPVIVLKGLEPQSVPHMIRMVSVATQSANQKLQTEITGMIDQSKSSSSKLLKRDKLKFMDGY